jgi:hypothetical protein
VGTNIAGNVRRSALSLRTADDPEPQEAQGAQVVHPAHGCGVNTETVAVLRPKGAEGERAVLRPPPASRHRRHAGGASPHELRN